MKKFLLIALGCVVVSMAYGRDFSIRFEQLPERAQEYILSNFSESDVLRIEQDDYYDPDYDVYIKGGLKLEFNSLGHMEKVEARKGIPLRLLPREIAEYLDTVHPGERCVGFEIDDDGYEVKMRHDLELKFDWNFNLIEVDW